VLGEGEQGVKEKNIYSEKDLTFTEQNYPGQKRGSAYGEGGLSESVSRKNRARRRDRGGGSWKTRWIAGPSDTARGGGAQAEGKKVDQPVEEILH